MSQQNRIVPEKSFLFWWSAATIFVWPISTFIAVVAGVGVGIALTILEEFGFFFFPISMELHTIGATFLAIAFLGGIIGYTAGMLQQLILRRRLYRELNHWRFYSTIGGFIGGLLIAVIVAFFTNYNYANTTPPFTILLLIPLFMFVISGAQYLALRHFVRFASLWVLANIVAGLVITGLIFLNPTDRFEPFYALRIAGLFIMAGISPGLITGVAIAHLFERHSYEDELESEKPHSIWNEAI